MARTGPLAMSDLGPLSVAVDVSSKRLSLFKEAVPNMARVALVLDPREPLSRGVKNGYEKAAKAIGLKIRAFEDNCG